MPVNHIFRRTTDGNWFFRWVVPPRYRDLLNGRNEIKHTLKTTDREAALRMSQRIMASIDSVILNGMAKQQPYTAADIMKLLISADGSIQAEGVKVSGDPAQAEEERKTLTHIFQLARTQKPLAPPASSSLKLSALVDAFMGEAKIGDRFTVKTAQELGSVFKDMLEVVGDRPIDSLVAMDFTKLKDTLAKLPSNAKKNPRYRGKSVAELAAMPIPPDERLSPSTVNKQMKRVAGLFHWALNQGYVTVNVAKGKTIATGKREEAGRKAYTDEEVRRLLDAVATGAHDSHDKGWKRWIVLLGAYTGARITELAQLRCEDVKEVDGFSVLSLTNTGEGQKLKTRSSKRLVPVHSKLIEAGLPRLWAEQRAKGEKQLLPDIPWQRDGYGKSASAWFNKWRLKIGLDKDFHSLRHTVVTKLHEADVPTEDIADLVGHSRGRGETERTYMKRASIARLHAALSKLSYD